MHWLTLSGTEGPKMAPRTQALGFKSVDTCSQDEKDSAIALLHLALVAFSNDREHVQAAYSLFSILHSNEDLGQCTQSREGTVDPVSNFTSTVIVTSLQPVTDFILTAHPRYHERLFI